MASFSDTRGGGRERISAGPAPPVPSPTEDSHSGRVRTLGKRVRGNPSRVQIPHPPPSRRRRGSLQVYGTAAPSASAARPGPASRLTGVIFKRVGDGKPYPEHALSSKGWSALSPRQVRLDELVTSSAPSTSRPCWPRTPRSTATCSPTSCAGRASSTSRTDSTARSVRRCANARRSMRASLTSTSRPPRAPTLEADRDQPEPHLGARRRPVPAAGDHRGARRPRHRRGRRVVVGRPRRRRVGRVDRQPEPQRLPHRAGLRLPGPGHDHGQRLQRHRRAPAWPRGSPRRCRRGASWSARCRTTRRSSRSRRLPR